MRGTLLNTATVAVGAVIGLAVGKAIPEEAKTVALHGLGLVTVGMSVKMFLQAKNPLIVALSIAIGGLIGLALGLHQGIESIGEWSKLRLGQGDSATFTSGLLSSFVLFCIGPMTLLGCLQDALEHKIDLLSLKSTLDGIAAMFMAAASGAGVLVTAGLLLLFQGGLTLLAKPLSPVANDSEMIEETSGTGGAMLLATGIGLLGLADLHTANYLPAIVIAPGIVWMSRKLPKKVVTP